MAGNKNYNKPRIDNFYIKIRGEILKNAKCHPELKSNPSYKLVIWAILEWCNPNYFYAFPQVTRLIRDLDVSQSTVYRALDTGEKLNIFHVRRGDDRRMSKIDGTPHRHKGYEYYLVWPHDDGDIIIDSEDALEEVGGLIQKAKLKKKQSSETEKQKGKDGDSLSFPIEKSVSQDCKKTEISLPRLQTEKKSVSQDCKLDRNQSPKTANHTYSEDSKVLTLETNYTPLAIATAPDGASAALESDKGGQDDQQPHGSKISKDRDASSGGKADQPASGKDGLGEANTSREPSNHERQGFVFGKVKLTTLVFKNEVEAFFRYYERHIPALDIFENEILQQRDFFADDANVASLSLDHKSMVIDYLKRVQDHIEWEQARHDTRGFVPLLDRDQVKTKMREIAVEMGLMDKPSA